MNKIYFLRASEKEEEEKYSIAVFCSFYIEPNMSSAKRPLVSTRARVALRQ